MRVHGPVGTFRAVRNSCLRSEYGTCISFSQQGNVSVDAPFFCHYSLNTLLSTVEQNKQVQLENNMNMYIPRSKSVKPQARFLYNL